MSTLPATSFTSRAGWLLSGLLLVIPATSTATRLDFPRLAGTLPTTPTMTEGDAEPQARTYLEPATPSPGQPFDLVVELRWSHDHRPAVLTPPAFQLPDGLDQLTVRTLTSDSGDGARAVWHITLTAEEPGEFRLSPLTVSWETPAGVPGSTSLAIPTVVVGSASTPRRALTLVAGLGSLSLLLWLAWGRLRRSRTTPERDSLVDEDRRQRMEAAWREARRRRLAGDRGAAVERLVELERELGGLGLETLALGDQPLEEIRYGGRLPSGPELDQLERRVERALLGLRPDPDAERRRALGLGERPAGKLWRNPS